MSIPPLLGCAKYKIKFSVCLSVCLNPIFKKLRWVKFCAKQMFCIVVVWDSDIENTNKPTDTPIVTKTIEDMLICIFYSKGVCAFGKA